MDEIKKVARDVEQGAKETLRKIDGDEDLKDKVGNAGDEARKDLGNAGDDIKRSNEQDREQQPPR